MAEHASREPTLVERLCSDIGTRIERGELLPGTKVPSIRQQADDRGISRFTVVDAYERLVATGYLESRKGSGFFVVSRVRPDAMARRHRREQSISPSWLVRNQFDNLVTRANMPGSALLPGSWLDAGMLAANVRAVGRGGLQNMLHYGLPAGFTPLRHQLMLKLAGLQVAARLEQIVLTSGVTQGLDLVCRSLLSTGDTVLVETPAWYRVFTMFAGLGLKVVGVPRLEDGPDIEKLRALSRRHRPKLVLINSVLHNPTGTTLSPAKAHAILQIAEKDDFRVAEVDVFGDFHDGMVARLASLDQLRRVIYLSSFSKTLSATLRVGFIACSEPLAEALIEQKLKSCLTTSELGERVVHRVLSDGHYRKHVARIRNRISTVRETALRKLQGAGLKIPWPPQHGLLVWADTGVDTDTLAMEALSKGYVLAPGSLFTVEQKPSRWMRFNLTTTASPQFLAFLGRALR